MTGRRPDGQLAGALTDYLAQRRALGFGLVEEERHTRGFLQWLAERGAAGPVFTTAQAVRWAIGPGDLKRSYQRQRLQAVRGLARYCRAVGMLDVEVPPAGALGGGGRRIPHIYSQSEIDQLITACPRAFDHPHVQATMPVVINLLAATGIRIGEVLRLRPTDIDDDHATVLVRANKHGPDRIIPLHPSTLTALRAYQYGPTRRATGPGREDPLIVSTRGTCYATATIQAHFERLRAASGLTWSGNRPCLHDFRHTFATTQMIHAYTDPDEDPAHMLALLCTWLGHSDPSHTYWYVQAVPELLALAARRKNTPPATSESD